MGRWNQVDPIYKFNESGYVSMTNNPINFADPLGLDTIPTVIAPKPPGRDQEIDPVTVPDAAPAPPSPTPPSYAAQDPKNSSTVFVRGLFRAYFYVGPLGVTGSMAVGVTISDNRITNEMEYGLYITPSLGVFEGIPGGVLAFETGGGRGGFDQFAGLGMNGGLIIPFLGGGEVSHPIFEGNQLGDSFFGTLSIFPNRALTKGGGFYFEATHTSFLIRSGEMNDVVDYIMSYSPKSLRRDQNFNLKFKDNLISILSRMESALR